MAYAYVQDVASSWDQYAQVAAALVDPAPEGLLVHIAGPTDEGVRIIDVWESEEAGDLFRAERLVPAIAALRGPTRPEPTFRDLRPEHVVLRQGADPRPRGAERRNDEKARSRSGARRRGDRPHGDAGRRDRSGSVGHR